MPALRVIKVGGSLLNWPELPLALDAWLTEQPPAIDVLIAGGGDLVDAIRDASRMFLLDDEAAHWRAIDAMSITCLVLAGILADAKLISAFSELQLSIGRSPCQRIVFDPNSFLREHERRLPGCLLPHDWSVTSDSIAARVAEVLKADELVLLKSADPPANDATELANRGFVDRYFPAFDRCCFRPRFVNLRLAAKCPVGLRT